MKILLAIIISAMFSTIALAEDFKGERLSSEARQTLKAEFKAQKDAIKELPEDEREAAMDALKTERKAKKIAALQEAGVSDEEIAERMENQKEKRKKRKKRKESN